MKVTFGGVWFGHLHHFSSGTDIERKGCKGCNNADLMH